ncbi:MAG: DUF2851 family protein, partial [Flavicella sp.]
MRKYDKRFEGSTTLRGNVIFREDFLQYLWKLQLFERRDLKTVEGHPICVVKPGVHNFQSGPDFLMGQLHMGEKIWVGHVEIHLKSSDWYVHNHHKNSAYDPVILHVVWEYDMPVLTQNGVELPCLELKQYVFKQVVDRYQQFLGKRSSWIVCENEISEVPSFTIKNWMDRLYVERLEAHSLEIERLLNETTHDWEAVLFLRLTATFGLHLNKTAFMNLANSFEFILIRKFQGVPNGVESLLFGQAGFLKEEKEDNYYQKLKKSYDYVRKKYKLTPLNNAQFQFFRLRPANFPTLRIAQLAQLYETHKHLFSKVLKAKVSADFYELFQVRAALYWNTHYVFEKASKGSVKRVSKSFVDLLMINTIIPLKYVYLKMHKERDVSE